MEEELRLETNSAIGLASCLKELNKKGEGMSKKSYRTFFYVFVTWVLYGKRRTTHKIWIAPSENVR